MESQEGALEFAAGMVRAQVLISGVVQGVFFRHYTSVRANELGVKGWVKNRMDGKVEAIFEGKKDKVDELIKWCNRGPSGARVTEVNVDWEDYRDEFDSFTIEGW